LPSRIAIGPTATPESIRGLIRSDPSVVEPGLRLFDFNLQTGTMVLDAIGVDRSGRLAIVAVSPGDPEPALARLLDGHLWAADQCDLLKRLYSERGMKGDHPARGFLLAPSFTHAFLRRLSLLSVEITPCLARTVDGGEGSRLTIIEPAASLFGLEPDPALGRAGAQPVDRQPFWPEGVLPADETLPRGGRPRAPDAVEAPEIPALAASPDRDEAMPWPDTAEERFAWDIDPAATPESAPAERGGAVTTTDALPSPEETPLPDEPAPPGAFETLSIDEMEEFERFERQRRERGRRSS
jgi:hypothetical protein